MPPQSRGANPPLGFQSKSTPNLSTLRTRSLPAENSSPRTLHPSILSPLPASPPDAAPIDPDSTSKAQFSSDSESEDEAASQQHPQLRRFYSQHESRSYAHLHPSASQLFPPFYNRPPTPLPPSPSLTSLLRPSFSTHTSHHTTPESSDVESQPGGSTAAAVEKSAQAATTIPRASPKVPTYEYYGFALYLASSMAFLMYVLWSYLPSPFLHQLGIYYYPNRWWALAVPAWLVVVVLYIYVALASYNTGYLTLPMQSIENLVDDAAQIAVVDKDGRIIRPKKVSRFQNGVAARKVHARHSRQSSGGIKSVGPQGLLGGKDVNWGAIWDEGTDAVLDIPIGGVCEILYGGGR